MALGVTLDSEILTALAEQDPRAVAIVKAARESGALVYVPAVVLAESTTGDSGRDARVNRITRRLETISADAEVGRLAGLLRFRTGLTHATVDALVVASAATHGGGRLLAVDPDARALAAEAGVRCRGLPGRDG